MLAAALVAVPAAAEAAPGGGGGGKYAWAHASENVRCDTGATCTVEASASRDGAGSGTSLYSRAGATSSADEAGWVGAVHGLEVAVPPGATRLVVTATWDLDLQVAARSESGTTYAELGLRIDVPQCGPTSTSCRTTTPTRQTVLRVHDTPFLLPYTTGTTGRRVVSHAVTVEGSALPEELGLRVDVGGSAGGYPDCSPNALGCPSPVVQRHAGTASAHFSGTLLGVSVQAVG